MNVSAQPHGGIVAELSRRWVENLTAQLLESGRRLEGGWPGTLSDARRLLVQRAAALSDPLPRAEFDRLVKAIYDDAKSQWLAIASRSPSLPQD